tara:strand:+ start:23 stop:823 length:801 start_codon:yes stop_codon:yes gene_type:complete
MLFSDGPDEFLGGYLADVEANKIDNVIGSNKPLKFIKHLSKINLGKKLIINLLNLKRNKEFEFSYEPFYTRVNHMVSPNSFLNRIIHDYDTKKLYDYGLIDPIYREIIKDMDYSQIRALNYASKTLPDVFNLRLDKALMQYSVEGRLPFQSIELAEFFIAMPSKYRFNNGQGKYFLRNYVNEKIDKLIGKIPKRGMGKNLWSNDNIYNALNFEDVIRGSDFFSNYPFKKNVKNILLDSKTHLGNRWIAFALIKTQENLKKINAESI